MLKNIPIFEIEKNGKKISVLVHDQMSFGELFDLSCDFRDLVIKKIDEMIDSQKPKESTQEAA